MQPKNLPKRINQKIEIEMPKQTKIMVLDGVKNCKLGINLYKLFDGFIL